jgi:hypothetical protein
MYLKWIQSHLKDIDWLCCDQGPVAYAHRQTSVTLGAKTGHELVDLHRTLLGLYFAERVFIDDLRVDCIVHELPSELDPSVDRGRGHPFGFELLVKLVRAIKNPRQSDLAVREFS